MSSFSPSWEGYFNAKTVGHKKKWLSLHGMTISGSKAGFHQGLETWKRQIGKNWSTGKPPLQLLDPSNCTFPFITPMHMAYSKKKTAYLKCHNVAKLTLNICNRSFNLTLNASEALPPMWPPMWPIINPAVLGNCHCRNVQLVDFFICR